MDKEKLERINARMNIAKDKLVVAADLIADGHYDDAVSRAYYAMFYASKALLLAVGEDPHKHKGVVTLFGKRFAKLGLQTKGTVRPWQKRKLYASYAIMKSERELPLRKPSALSPRPKISLLRPDRF